MVLSVVAGIHIAQVLELLAELDRELALASGCVGQLVRASRDGADTGAALRDLRVAHTLLRAKISLIRARTLDDAASDDDAREASLRGRTNLILTNLATLASEPVSRKAFVGRFASLVDVRTYLLDRIGRINAGWLCEKRARARVARSAVAHEALARVALANAESAYALIGRDLDLAHFLRVGTVSPSEAVRTACHEIAAVVDPTGSIAPTQPTHAAPPPKATT